MNIQMFWKKRFEAFTKLRVYYLANLIRGFFTIPLILMLMGTYYYPKLMEHLPSAFPTVPVMVALLALLVTLGRHRTLLESADIVFLTPMENRLTGYFRKLYSYNWAIQGFGLLFVTLLIGPLIVHRVTRDPIIIWMLVIMLILLKGVNLYLSWNALRLRDIFLRNIHMGIRLLTNGLLIYGLFEKRFLFIILAVILYIGFFYWNQKILQRHLFPWMELVRMEEKLNSSFYGFLQFFMDVDHLQGRVRERHFLPKITRILPYHPSWAYEYLFYKILFRHETFSMLLRLLGVGMILLYFIPDRVTLYVVYILMIVIAGMQFRSFWETYQGQFWVDLYPIPQKNQKASFVTASYRMLLLQGILLILPRIFSPYFEGSQWILPFIGAIVAYFISIIFLKRRMETYR